jgi:hypothetical protein
MLTTEGATSARGAATAHGGGQTATAYPLVSNVQPNASTATLASPPSRPLAAAAMGCDAGHRLGRAAALSSSSPSTARASTLVPSSGSYRAHDGGGDVNFKWFSARASEEANADIRTGKVQQAQYVGSHLLDSRRFNSSRGEFEASGMPSSR